MTDDPLHSFQTTDKLRAQVLEVIVRQALAGAPWQEICAGPMRVNNISTEEVLEELRKRRGDAPPSASMPRKPGPKQPDGSASIAPPKVETGIE